MSTVSIGAQAENLARQYLETQGLIFIEKNYRVKCGEIDLIMQDNEELVFVEVRYRKQQRYGKSIETINSFKCRKLTKTAQYYLQQRQIDDTVMCRFDVLGIDIAKQQVEYSWLKNAFQVVA